MTHITDKNIGRQGFTSVTIGNFDGLHMGHRRLIDAVKSEGRETVVFSFFPHPVSVFKGETFRSILTSAEKSALLKELGIDLFVEYPFDKETAGLTPEEFIRDVLVKQLKCKTIAVGEGYRFGKSGRGDCKLLLKYSGEYGYEVRIIPHVMMGNEKISSTYIREAIGKKRFDEVERYMGRPYFVLGEVVGGNKLGRAIDVPTANIKPPKNKLLPPAGVYRTKVTLNGVVYDGMTNVGTRPTVNSGMDKVVETHILGFDRDIYGEELTVEFFGWIRGEMKFSGIDELRRQIMRDIGRIT